MQAAGALLDLKGIGQVAFELTNQTLIAFAI